MKTMITIIYILLIAVYDIQAATCEYHNTLNTDYVERIRFSTTLDRSQEIRSLSFTEDDRSVDKVSLMCMTCHDGILATHSPVTTGKPSGGFGKNHPIGMDYAQVSFTKRGYVNRQNINRAIHFIDGKVGCMSCHNVVNNKAKHLVTDMDNSELCFVCHIK